MGHKLTKNTQYCNEAGEVNPKFAKHPLSPEFLNMVKDAQTRVKEIDLENFQKMRKENPNLVVLDIREQNEWQAGHLEGAKYLSRGLLERDLQTLYPDYNT